MEQPQYVIFDLDGTLANIEHRRHLVEGGNKEWDAFFAGCIDDTPNEDVVWLYNVLEKVPDLTLLIFSGRSEAVREETLAWLYEHVSPSIKEKDVRMRPQGNYRPDDMLKREWLDDLQAWNDDFAKIRLVVDDRDKVVKMWRDVGITCLQVAEGGF